MPAYFPFSVYRNINVGATGAVVKASPGVVSGYYLSNSGAAAVYVKLYNKATAPTEADTPVLTLMLPAGGAANLPPTDSAIGGFTAGIGVRATTAVADNSTAAPGANEVVVNLFYS